jgi:hypothetical protein
MCPALALRLTTTPAPGVSQRARGPGGRAALPARPRELPAPAPARPARAERPDSGREIEGLVVTEAWIAQLGGDR